MSYGKEFESRDFLSNIVHAIFVEAPAVALAFIKSIAGLKAAKQH